MDSANAANRHRDYYQSTKYSDITIRFSGRELPAHKIVLAEGSEYFRALFEHDFKVGSLTTCAYYFELFSNSGKHQEASAAAIDLHDDHAHALCGMIATFYGHSGHEKTSVTNSENGAAYVMYTIDLYVTASKYLVPTLCSEVVRDMGEMMEVLTEDDGYPEHLGRVANHIYATHADAAVDLRKPLVHIIVQHVNMWKDSDGFKQLLADIPDLAFDVVLTLAGNKGGSPTRKLKGAAASAGKRKRVSMKEDGDLTLDGMAI